MQRPTGPGRGPELESAFESLNISRDHGHQAQASREPSSTGSDQHHGSQAGSSGEQHSGQQIGGALKASHEEVWYLKSIDFTSPSGVTRTCNVITQNYNGCVYHRYCSNFLARDTAGQAMFVHRDMQHPDPAWTNRDTSPRSQERFVRIPRAARR
jgi:hypothetical protein